MILILTFISGHAAANITAGLVVAELPVEYGSHVDGQFVDGGRGVEVHVGLFEAEAIVLTRQVQTLTDVLITVFAAIAFETGADVVVDGIRAGGIVHAWKGGALINVDLTVDALEASVVAHASIRVDSILTETAVQARATLEWNKGVCCYN